MENATTTLPPSWAQIVERYVQGYGNARCERWNENLVYVRNGLPKPMQFEDPVLHGFARKAAQTLAHTCTGCGRSAKRRFHSGGWTVQCAGCFGKFMLAHQIGEFIEQALGNAVSPFDDAPVVWPEHELPLLLRACIPADCWRHTTPPDGQTMRYVAREDVQGLAPWLMKLKQVMQRTTSEPLQA